MGSAQLLSSKIEEKSLGLNITSGKGSDDDKMVAGGSIKLLLLPPTMTPLPLKSGLPIRAQPCLAMASTVVTVFVVLPLLLLDDEDIVKSICVDIDMHAMVEVNVAELLELADDIDEFDSRMRLSTFSA